MSTSALFISLLMVIGNAFFVAFEFSLIAARRGEISDLADGGNRSARRVLDQMRKVDGYLAACQFGITLTSLSLTAAFEPAVQAALTPILRDAMSPQLATSLSVVFAIGVATSIQVVFGELVPKTVAITIPTTTVIATSGLMRWAYILSTPLNATYNRLANAAVRVLTGKSLHDAHDAESFDAEVLVELAMTQGQINTKQHELMNAVLEFPTRTAREVMTPADRVVSLGITEDADTVFQRIRETRHTRYPVLDGDTLLGYVLIHELYRQRLDGSFNLRAILREMVSVPETVHLSHLRSDNKEHPIMAVYDERNQFVGIITAEDLMEEIVGEILDEDEQPERPPVQRLSSGSVLIDGTALVEEVCETLGLECTVPDGVDTFGGLLLSRLGREPQHGDVIKLQEWIFTIRQSKGFSIRLVEGKGPIARKKELEGA